MTATKDEGSVEGVIRLGPTPLLTAAQLAKIAPRCRVADAAELFGGAMRAARILTVRQRSSFLANVLHESDELRYQREVWGPTSVQLLYERDPTCAWPPTPRDDRNAKAFKLGNSEPGDGFKFRGAGPMQTTGRTNILGASLRLYGDDRLIAEPELLDDRLVGIRLATDFWRVGAGLNLTDYARKLGARDGCDCNDLAEVEHGEVALVRAAVNGGRNGLEHVARYYLAALAALSG